MTYMNRYLDLTKMQMLQNKEFDEVTSYGRGKRMILEAESGVGRIQTRNETAARETRKAS
jgi:hypothetical protein